MLPKAPIALEQPFLDREKGQSHDRALLRHHLLSAPTDYLAGALENPELGPDELVLLLRNRAGTNDLLVQVGRQRSFMRARAVQLAFVCHPKAPQLVARRFLPHLSWRDLLEVAVNVRLSPVLRREAERLLMRRIPELTVGEKMAAARRGSRGVVTRLLTEPDATVLQAAASNSRTTELDLAEALTRPDLPSAFLGWLAERSSWGRRRLLRLALVRHPRTPPSSSLRLARELSSGDLDALRHDAAASRLIRVAAERLLAASSSEVVGSGARFG